MKASIKYVIAGTFSFFCLFSLSDAQAQSYTSGTFSPQAAPVKKTPAQDFFGPNKLQSSIFGGKNVSGAEMFKPREEGGTNGTFGKDVFASRLPSRARPALIPNQSSSETAYQTEPNSDSGAGQQSDSFAVEDSNAATPQTPPNGAPNGEAIKEAMGDSEIQKVLEQTRKIKESVFGRSNELPEGVQSRDDIPSLPVSRKEESNRF